jgi:transposase
METAPQELPRNVAELQALVLSARETVAALEAEVTTHKAELRFRDLLIEKLKHQLAGHRRHRFGARSETLDQLDLSLEDEEIAAADRPAASDAFIEAPAKAAPKRGPLPAHLPRLDEVLSAGDSCSTCGGRLKRVGEDVTEELEYVPGRFIVNRIIRPRLACACCERFHQMPLPSRPIERGRPGPGLLAHVLVSKYADHLPLYRQSGIYAREGVDLGRSTLAGWVGQTTALLSPLADAVARHVLGKTKTARLWTYVRDERPWAGEAPPAALYRFSADRQGIHPAAHLEGYGGFLHADGYAGFEALFRTGEITEVACMAHIRRKFVDIYEAQGSAIAEEAIRRIAGLYEVEARARGQPPDARARLRQAEARPLFEELQQWLHAQLPRISGKTPLAVAIRYALTRMKRLGPWLRHGFVELDNNAAERAIRPLALGRKNWLFAGSARGGRSAAIAYTLIETARLNDVDPEAWLRHVLDVIADHPAREIDALLPWNCRAAPADRDAVT